MPENHMKDLQKVELEILIETDRICKKHNIRYFLVAGTLLGAIRHKGFIPWDDDIDICMPIEDYRKFCKVAKKELNKNYFLQNYKTDFSGMWFSKIRKNNTTAIEKNFESKLHHQGIWIDVFPLIGIKHEKKWIENLKSKVLPAKKLINKKIGIMEDIDKKPIFKILNFFISMNLLRLITSAIYRVSFKSPSVYKYCYYLWASSAIKPRFESEWFSESCEVEFEGHMFPAPKDWDKYLTIEYGDYMTPPPPEKRNGGSHTISIVDINNNYTKYIKK